jgi:hypothetical protein
VRTTGLEAFQREIGAKGYRYDRPGIAATPWGSRMMEVVDPFHNRLRFAQQSDP